MNPWAFVALVFFLAVTACSRSPDGTNGSVGLYSLFDPVAANPSLCGSPAIPFPNNALFSGTTDATLNIPNPAGAPFVTAANLTDGFSTTASIFTDVLGAVDYGTAAGSILILEAGAAPRFLAAGVDFTVQPSIAMAQASGTGHSAGTCTGTLPARFRPISEQRSRILIEPLKPLKPSTTYVVAVTRSLLSRDGVPATANEFFPLVNSDTKLCRLSGAETSTELLCSDTNAPAAAAAALGAPVLAALAAPPTTPVQKLTTLETLRRSLIRPTVTALKSAHSVIKGSTLNDSDLVIAWSFTTQSVSKSLASLNTTPVATPRTIGVAFTGLNTNQANAALASFANIYSGTVSLPYFLQNSGGSTTSTAPLTTFWAADTGAIDNVNPPALGGTVSCSALAPPASTTICYPRPLLRTNETVPLLVTVPNASAPNAGGSCGGRGTIANTGTHGTCVAPTNGWPVAIFQHGITRNRTDMLALAPTLAAAGFMVVAIDLPLHGLPVGHPLRINGLERTFDLDLVNNATGAPGPDGAADSSGTHFINLSSLITSRDNLRQGASDLIHLAKSVNNINLDGNTATNEVNATRLHFVGQSLGAMVGTVALGVNTDIKAASLHVPGGGLGKLLDASASFGPRIAVGLAASFVFEGTDTYETFNRFAQHLTDPGDPINYAVAANANHAIHLVQVIGDAVVPNSAGSTCPATLPAGIGATAATIDAAGTAAASGAAGAALVAACPTLVIPANPPLAAITYQDETVITGFLSGTDPLVRIMGLTTTVRMGNTPFAAQASAGADTVVQFAPDTAEHGTLLTPVSSAAPTASPPAFAAATCAMQKQTATFLATDGTVIPVGGSCP